MTQSMPRLRKARRVTGTTIALRDARPDDANFILALRAYNKKNQHLAKPTGLAEQIDYLERYAHATGQAYFIIEDLNGGRLGTVRLYDEQGMSFAWGSWLVADGAPARTAIESALLVYAYGFDVLGFEQSHFDVRRDNERVWRFHERFGATLLREDARDRYYRMTAERLEQARVRHRRFLTSGDISWEFLEN